MPNRQWKEVLHQRTVWEIEGVCEQQSMQPFTNINQKFKYEPKNEHNMGPLTINQKV